MVLGLVFAALLLAVAESPTLPLVINLGLPKTGSTSLHECEWSKTPPIPRFIGFVFLARQRLITRRVLTEEQCLHAPTPLVHSSHRMIAVRV
jgi:hypothetical protein